MWILKNTNVKANEITKSTNLRPSFPNYVLAEPVKGFVCQVEGEIVDYTGTADVEQENYSNGTINQ